MIDVTIQPDQNQLREWRAAADHMGKPELYNKALASAVRRAGQHGMTKFKQSISGKSGKYTAPSKKISELMKLVSSKGSTSATIKFQGSRLPIYDYFKVTPKKPIPQLGKHPSARKPVNIEVVKGIKRPSRNAFVADLPIRGLGLYHRDPETGQVKTRTGSSIVTMADRDEVREPAWNAVQEMLRERIDHEMNRLINRN